MSRSRLYRELKDVITHIEQHIEEPLSLEQIAELSAISKAHLSRMFKAMSGLSLAQYIRERKLAVSLSVLRETDDKIIDIALRFGFSYEQTYIRAFKQAFGITPHQYRLECPEVHFTSKLELSTIVWLEKGLWLPPTCVRLPQFDLVSKSISLSRTEVHSLWHSNLIDYLTFSTTHFEKKPKEAWGIAVRALTQEKPVTYITGLSKGFFLEHKYEVPQDHQHLSIESSTYMAFKYIGNHGLEALTTLTLQEFTEDIIKTWYPVLGYTCTNPIKFVLDRYPLESASRDYCEYFLYLPLSGKSTKLITYLSDNF